MLIYESLAQAFAAEGVDTQFGLMGDGNMHWMSALDALPGVTTVNVRHEHCSVLMAMGYWSATGNVGICSVTHGPGFTQIMTGLTTAARNNVPLVVFAGETSIGAPWALQAMDQAPLARACGAEYIAVHSPTRIFQQVQEAFYLARTRSMPVVIGVPLDIQKMQTPNIAPYKPSTLYLAPDTPLPPDPSSIADWAVPSLPIKGGDIVARGVARGPEVARVLQAVEKRWIAEGFPDGARVRALLDEVLAAR